MIKNELKNKLFSILILSVFLLSSMQAIAIDNNTNELNQEIIENNPEKNDVTYLKANSYSELVGWYQTLENKYPNYIEVFKANDIYNLGQAAGGYDCYYVRITNEQEGLHKPEVLFLGSPHGDETVGTNNLYWFTDWLMRKALTSEEVNGYSKDWLNWILDNREIYFEVAHNPYGFDNGPQRYDGNGWDLNREADHDGPGSPTGGIWASIPGQTLYHFVNDHQFRVGSDFHGGARMLLYPWSSSHDSIQGTSPITGYTYTHAPPDFNFYDTSSLRVGDYIGDYGGDLNKYSVGTIPDTVGYEAPGGMTPWGYGADVIANPAEDPYVEDEVFGNYPGSGMLWVTPEWSNIKNEPESKYGSDDNPKYGAEVRRFVLHQTDIAQPYVRWMENSPKNNQWFAEGTPITFRWQVNGSMVVDHTQMQWGTNSDPIHYPESYTQDNNQYAGAYIGGTGWENAEDGTTDGVIYEETFNLAPGTYSFVAKAQVDQVYANVLRPDVYGDNPYLRLIKERTDATYQEEISGIDGTERMDGQLWWYSPVIDISIGPDDNPPSTSLGFFGSVGDEGWIVGDSRVFFDSSDDLSGVNFTMYRLDGGEWNEFMGSVDVGDGVHVLEFYSVDFAGNVEDVVSEEFKVDTVAPVTEVVLSGSEGVSGWFSGDVSVGFDCVDEGSGVDRVLFRVDGDMDFDVFDESVVVSGDGFHSVFFYGVDVAGNVEDVQEVEFVIDSVDPVASFVFPSGGEVLSGVVDVEWSMSDDRGDPVVVLLEYSFNGGESWYPVVSDLGGVSVFSWDTFAVVDGEYVLRLSVEDFAGNGVSVVSDGFVVENGVEPPEVFVELSKPVSGCVYVGNRELLFLPGSFVLVFGSLDVEFDAWTESSLTVVERVELFVDGVCVFDGGVDDVPGVWSWESRVFGRSVLRLVAFDDMGNSGEVSLSVVKLF